MCIIDVCLVVGRSQWSATCVNGPIIKVSQINPLSRYTRRLTEAHLNNLQPIVMIKSKLQQYSEDWIIKVLDLAEMIPWVTPLGKESTPVEVLTKVKGNIEEMM